MRRQADSMLQRHFRANDMRHYGRYESLKRLFPSNKLFLIYVADIFLESTDIILYDHANFKEKYFPCKENEAHQISATLRL